MAKKTGLSTTFEVKIDGDGWIGKASLTLLPRIDRAQIAQDYQDKSEGMSVVDTVKYVEAAVAKQVVSISLKHIESGEEFKSLEELQYIEEGDAILNKLFHVVLRGRPTGNVLRLQSKDRPLQPQTEG